MPNAVDLASCPARSTPTETPASPAPPALTLAVATLLGAEALHAATYSEHRDEWVWAGVFFAVVCLAQWLTAWVLLTRRGGTGPAAFAIALSLAIVTVWAFSRTVGMPFGPGRGVPEPVGWADFLSTAFELTTAAAAWSLIRPREGVSRTVDRRQLSALSLAIVGAVTTFGVLAPETPHEYQGVQPCPPITPMPSPAFHAAPFCEPDSPPR